MDRFTLFVKGQWLTRIASGRGHSEEEAEDRTERSELLAQSAELSSARHWKALQFLKVLETLNEPLHKAVTFQLLVGQEVKSAHEIFAHTVRRGVGPKNLRRCGPCCPVKPRLCEGSSSHIGRRTPRTTSCTASSVPRRNPPDVVFKRILMTVRAHVRQRGSSLPSDRRDDPPQEARALLQGLLHNALPRIVLLAHLAVALLYLHTRPRIETYARQELRPVVFFSSLHHLSDPCACQIHTVTVPRERQLFSVW